MDVRNFWEYVDISEDDICWEWTLGKRRSRGHEEYGNVKIKGKAHFAHRIAYELAIGKIPEGMVVCHRCDNPPCCNPLHLFAGSQGDNIRDMIAKGRNIKPRGKDHHGAKLTEVQVLEIYSDPRLQQVIADEYGISLSAINHIKRGRNWAHLTGYTVKS